ILGIVAHRSSTIVFIINFPFLSANPAVSITLHGVTDALKPEFAKYADALKAGEAAFIDAEKLFADFETKEGWKKTDFLPSFPISRRSTGLERNEEMMSRFSNTVPNSPLRVQGIEALFSWNPTISFSDIIVPLTDNADIVHYGNNDILVIKGREFLTVRLYRQTPSGFIMASRSIDLQEVTVKSGKIRANATLGASQFRQNPSSPRSTLCDVVLLVDLKGDLPKKMVEQSMPAVLALLIEQNIKHFKELVRYS
ncbi:hypothetical protein PMAYCL1PPCAC_15956, partial [Pristionchus mayeri]